MIDTKTFTDEEKKYLKNNWEEVITSWMKNPCYNLYEQIGVIAKDAKLLKKFQESVEWLGEYDLNISSVFILREMKNQITFLMSALNYYESKNK